MGRARGGVASGLDIVDPAWFCSCEREKTKLNWFCYELSIGIYGEVREDLGRRLGRMGVGDEAIASFSVQMSKALKEEVLLKLSGRVADVRVSYETIHTLLPRLDDRTVDRVLDAVCRAWDEQLSVCEVCPTRCISERDARCTMFDDGPFSDGIDWPPTLAGDVRTDPGGSGRTSRRGRRRP